MTVILWSVRILLALVALNVLIVAAVVVWVELSGRAEQPDALDDQPICGCVGCLEWSYRS